MKQEGFMNHQDTKEEGFVREILFRPSFLRAFVPLW